MRFRWRDYAHGNRIKLMTLSVDEFLRRFLLHVLPGGFVRIRHFGFLANRDRTGKLARCRALLAMPPPAPPSLPESVAALMQRLTGVDITRCPVCRAGACVPSPPSGRATARPHPWTVHELAGARPPHGPSRRAPGGGATSGGFLGSSAPL